MSEPIWTCPGCEEEHGQEFEGRSGKAREITTTGISKILNVQHNHFIALSCTHCGFTELYDPSVLEGKAALSTILHVLFR